MSQVSFAVLRIRDVCPGSRIQGQKGTGSRIRIRNTAALFGDFMNSTFFPGLNLDPPKVPVPDRGCVTEFVMFFSILFLKVGGEAPS